MYICVYISKNVTPHTFLLIFNPIQDWGEGTKRPTIGLSLPTSTDIKVSH